MRKYRQITIVTIATSATICLLHFIGCFVHDSVPQVSQLSVYFIGCLFTTHCQTCHNCPFASLAISFMTQRIPMQQPPFWREVWVGRTSWGAAAVGMDVANSQLGCPAVELELPAGLGRNKRKRSQCGTRLSAQLSEQIDVSSLTNDNDANDPELPHKPMPDGRKCPTCFHKDDRWDPVEVQRVPPVHKLCWWGKSRCKKTGASRGHHCGYCIKIWTARWRHRKVEGQNMTLELWQRQLSEEEGALERHHNLVKVVINNDCRPRL